MLYILPELQLNLRTVFISRPPKSHGFVTLPLQSSSNFYNVIKNILLKVRIFSCKLCISFDIYFMACMRILLKIYFGLSCLIALHVIITLIYMGTCY